MEYVYSALLLNAAGKPIDEKGISGVLAAAGVAPDAARVKVRVIRTDEELMIARSVSRVLNLSPMPSNLIRLAVAEVDPNQNEATPRSGIFSIGSSLLLF